MLQTTDRGYSILPAMKETICSERNINGDTTFHDGAERTRRDDSQSRNISHIKRTIRRALMFRRKEVQTEKPLLTKINLHLVTIQSKIHSKNYSNLDFELQVRKSYTKFLLAVLQTARLFFFPTTLYLVQTVIYLLGYHHHL